MLVYDQNGNQIKDLNRIETYSNQYRTALIHYQSARYYLYTTYYRAPEEDPFSRDVSSAFADIRSVYHLMYYVMLIQLRNTKMKQMKFWIIRNGVEPLAIYEVVKWRRTLWCFHEVYKNIKTYYAYDPLALAYLHRIEDSRKMTHQWEGLYGRFQLR